MTADRGVRKAIDREVRRAMMNLELAERHPHSRYGCEEPGCTAIYEHPLILGSLGDTWFCPDHDWFSPLIEMGGDDDPSAA